MPAGHINETGVTSIREGRYKINRIELSFTMETISTENKDGEVKYFCYEINVLGVKPQAFFRPEWVKNA